MAGLPILGPALSGIHSSQASAMAWMATLVASATTLVIASLIICSVAIVCSISLVSFYFYCFYYFFTPDTMLQDFALL